MLSGFPRASAQSHAPSLHLPRHPSSFPLRQSLGNQFSVLYSVHLFCYWVKISSLTFVFLKKRIQLRDTVREVSLAKKNYLVHTRERLRQADQRPSGASTVGSGWVLRAFL